MFTRLDSTHICVFFVLRLQSFVFQPHNYFRRICLLIALWPWNLRAFYKPVTIIPVGFARTTTEEFAPAYRRRCCRIDAFKLSKLSAFLLAELVRTSISGGKFPDRVSSMPLYWSDADTKRAILATLIPAGAGFVTAAALSQDREYQELLEVRKTFIY